MTLTLLCAFLIFQVSDRDRLRLIKKEYFVIKERGMFLLSFHTLSLSYTASALNIRMQISLFPPFLNYLLWHWGWNPGPQQASALPLCSTLAQRFFFLSFF